MARHLNDAEGKHGDEMSHGCVFLLLVGTRDFSAPSALAPYWSLLSGVQPYV